MYEMLRDLNGRQYGNQYCFYWRNERFIAELKCSESVDYGWRDLLSVRQANDMYKNVFSIKETTGGSYNVDQKEVRQFNGNHMVKVTNFNNLINEITSWINFMMGDTDETSNLEWKGDDKKEISQLNSREKILIGMNEIIMRLNNESCMTPWLVGGVPDGADEEEILVMANDDVDFKYCASLFLDIIKSKSAYEDGIYIDGLDVINSESRKTKGGN